jgi:hypothetical protein
MSVHPCHANTVACAWSQSMNTAAHAALDILVMNASLILMNAPPPLVKTAPWTAQMV